jgi:hypothetical protein
VTRAHAGFPALALAAAFAAGCASWKPAPQSAPLAPPLEYRAPFTAVRPTVGRGLDHGAWAAAPWTADFGDIEGARRPAPRYRTRAKMLWDDTNLYLAAQLDEPHVWSTLAARDAVIFHDNDFEAFVDPDGDGNEYYELEANPRGTVFDLFLHRSYRNGGPAIHEWDAQGIVTEVVVDGTADDARDVDAGWTIQWTVPWSAFVPPRDARIDALPEDQRGFGDRRRAGAPPRAGDAWRINFSRVQWRHNHEQAVVDGGRAPYAKVPGTPEDNWTWTPQWAVDMHLPQHWGRVTFVR